MVGEEPDAEVEAVDRSRSFIDKHPAQRICIVAAGPIFNLLFACLVFIAVYMIGVPATTTKIGEVVKDKPAARAGIVANDVITAVDGKPVDRWDEFAGIVAASKGRPLDVQVRRGEQVLTFRMTPESRIGKNLFGEAVPSPVVGVVAAGDIVIDRYGPLDAVVKGTAQTWRVIELTVLSLVKMVERVVPLDSIGGPIMIAKMAGQQATAGGVSFLAFMALLSVNLGVLNLLPVPILDGGHLVFYLWELVFRRPVGAKAREYAQQIGLMLLIGLMVLAFYNDIARYFFSQAQP
jgi:regulator of sigma E protease